MYERKIEDNNMREVKLNNEILASEVIADLERQIGMLGDKVKYLNMDINRLRIIFRAVYYAVSHGGISESEAVEAMPGIQTMIDVLKDNAEETAGICNS